MALRKAVGADVEIMVDGHRRLAPAQAIRLGESFAEARIAWYEEPSPPGNLALTAEVRRHDIVAVAQRAELRLCQPGDSISRDQCNP